MSSQFQLRESSIEDVKDEYALIMQIWGELERQANEFTQNCTNIQNKYKSNVESAGRNHNSALQRIENQYSTDSSSLEYERSSALEQWQKKHEAEENETKKKQKQAKKDNEKVQDDSSKFRNDVVRSINNRKQQMGTFLTRIDQAEVKIQAGRYQKVIKKGNLRVNQLEDKGIECLFISDLPFEYKKNSIMDISYEKDRDTLCKADEMENVDCVEFDTKANARSTISFYEYESEINRFVSKIEKKMGYEHYGKLLVLGTEECMYPAIRLGEILKKDGVAKAVKVHATTRSPIIASCEDGYPLNHRYQIRSVYDKERDTYVYNLKKYDKVIVVTDTGIVAEGMNDLLVALRSVGNKNILVSRWNYS